jgi:hypothetical protein
VGVKMLLGRSDHGRFIKAPRARARARARAGAGAMARARPGPWIG